MHYLLDLMIKVPYPLQYSPTLEYNKTNFLCGILGLKNPFRKIEPRGCIEADNVCELLGYYLETSKYSDL